MALMCAKCGNTMVEGAAFCPHCGERVAAGDAGQGRLIYQAEVKRPLRPAGKLMVYSDRTEYVTSSVQKAIFNYTGLVSVKKGRLESIDFVTEDGRTESCPVDRKCIHEAFLYIEQAVRPYLARRREELLAQGIYFSSFVPDGGTVNVLADRVEYQNRLGQAESPVFFRDVRAASLYTGTLELALTDGTSKNLPVEQAMGGEVLAFENANQE